MKIDNRNKRLQNDNQRLVQLASQNNWFNILLTEDNPPTQYILEFTCKSIKTLNFWKKPQYSYYHHLQCVLHDEYPSKGPWLKWLTPIFHPNIHESGVIGIFNWTPMTPLVELITFLSRLVQFQVYNVDDPMNAKAAAWIIRNPELTPTDLKFLQKIDDSQVNRLKELVTPLEHRLQVKGLR